MSEEKEETKTYRIVYQSEDAIVMFRVRDEEE
jgi:hypothetical protein